MAAITVSALTRTSDKFVETSLWIKNRASAARLVGVDAAVIRVRSPAERAGEEDFEADASIQAAVKGMFGEHGVPRDAG
jgi:hypothetical protein